MISVIIPTLNEQKYLPILLSQIKKQTFKDYEIIVADGGSKDKTVEIAKSFGCKVVKGGTTAKGRNEGAKAAKGEILVFLDADNIFLPENFFEKIIEEFEKKKLEVATSPLQIDGNFFDKIIYALYNFWVKLTQRFLAHASNVIIVKKEIFEKVGGFDEKVKIAEDHWFARKASKFGKFGIVNTKPVITAARRLERDGRLRTYFVYFLTGIYLFFFGPPKGKFFKYEFDHYDRTT